MTIQLRMGLEPMKTTTPSLNKEGQGMSAQAGGPSLHKEGQATIEARSSLDIEQQEELKPLQQEYTSLRDLITASATLRGGVKSVDRSVDMEELKLKDKLLKLAARAYLQPIVRESAPPGATHCIAQCWTAFTTTNRSLVFGLIEGLHRQADACVKFLRTQTFNLLHRFKLQQHPALSQ